MVETGRRERPAIALGKDAVGDEVQVPVGTFRVERMDGRRVDRVAFTPNESYESREALMQRLADQHAEKEHRG